MLAVTAITTLLGTVASMIPGLSTAVAIGNVIKTVADIAPVLIQTYQDVAPSVKGVIDALKANPATTAEQLAELEKVSAKVDADWDEAVKNQD